MVLKKMVLGLGVIGLTMGCICSLSQTAAAEEKAASSAVVAPAEKAAAPAAVASSAQKPAEVAASAAQKPAEPAAPAEANAAAPASQASLTVEEGVIATAIENRAPQGAAESFNAGVEHLYCFTKLSGGKAGDEVIHHWKKGDQSIAKVTLKVGGSPWRTYSTKLMPEDAVGKWSVDIMQGETVIKTLSFEIQAAATK